MVLKNTITFLEKTVNLPLVQEDGLLIIKHYEELQREKKELNDIIGVRVNRLLSILRTRILSVPTMVQKKSTTEQISLIEREEACGEVVIVDD
jgi:hypothetical protein